MKKNLLVAVGVFVLIGIIFGGFLIFKNRHLPVTKNTTLSEQKDQASSENSSNQTPSSENEDMDNTEDSDLSSNTTDMDENSSEDETDSTSETSDSDESFLDVTTKDCDNQCKDYSDSEDLKYCQNVCGLATISKESVSKTTKCETIEDSLEADYCFKNQAISKKDIKLCNSIIDSNIKKSCTNRFLEDILDQVPQE
ncbi:MAG: hypothetical protein HGA61_03920 [Candidatus Moranbacteria bacterium]|nr:hypothetical protein [Candidatus Moranbacteria bacterium]